MKSESFDRRSVSTYSSDNNDMYIRTKTARGILKQSKTNDTAISQTLILIFLNEGVLLQHKPSQNASQFLYHSCQGCSLVVRCLESQINKMRPKSLTYIFIHKTKTTNYELRGISSSLRLPQPGTSSMKKSFMFDRASVWNLLPKK